MRRTIAVVVFGVCGTSFAGGRDFIAEHAGAGANAQNAQPYIDQFLRIAESMTGWPANSAKGEWVDDLKGAEKAIAERKPGFAILDPEVFFELRKREALEPIAEVKGKTFNKGHYSLVVKEPALKSLADLEGQEGVVEPLRVAEVREQGGVRGQDRRREGLRDGQGDRAVAAPSRTSRRGAPTPRSSTTSSWRR